MKTENKELEKVPLLVIYKQGSTIYAEQPEEIIDLYQFYGFLKIYCDWFQNKLTEDTLNFEEENLK